jgi:hypothetical protein
LAGTRKTETNATYVWEINALIFGIFATLADKSNSLDIFLSDFR